MRPVNASLMASAASLMKWNVSVVDCWVCVSVAMPPVRSRRVYQATLEMKCDGPGKYAIG